MESQCVGVVGCWGLQFGEIAMWGVAVWAGCSVGRFFVGGSCGVGALQCRCVAVCEYCDVEELQAWEGCGVGELRCGGV